MNITLVNGSSGHLSTVLKFEDTIIDDVPNYSSSDTSVLSVDSSGNYQALSVGNTTLRVRYAKTIELISVRVEAKVLVDLDIDSVPTNLYLGRKYHLLAYNIYNTGDSDNNVTVSGINSELLELQPDGSYKVISLGTGLTSTILGNGEIAKTIEYNCRKVSSASVELTNGIFHQIDGDIVGGGIRNHAIDVDELGSGILGSLNVELIKIDINQGIVEYSKLNEVEFASFTSPALIFTDVDGGLLGYYFFNDINNVIIPVVPFDDWGKDIVIITQQTFPVSIKVVLGNNGELHNDDIGLPVKLTYQLDGIDFDFEAELNDQYSITVPDGFNYSDGVITHSAPQPTNISVGRLGGVFEVTALDKVNEFTSDVEFTSFVADEDSFNSVVSGITVYSSYSHLTIRNNAIYYNVTGATNTGYTILSLDASANPVFADTVTIRQEGLPEDLVFSVTESDTNYQLKVVSPTADKYNIWWDGRLFITFDYGVQVSTLEFIVNCRGY